MVHQINFLSVFTNKSYDTCITKSQEQGFCLVIPNFFQCTCSIPLHDRAHWQYWLALAQFRISNRRAANLRPADLHLPFRIIMQIAFCHNYDKGSLMFPG